MAKAEELKLATIAFPAIGGGVLGFPRDIAAETMVRACLQYIQSSRREKTIKNIRFINSGSATVISCDLRIKIVYFCQQKTKFYQQACQNQLVMGKILMEKSCYSHNNLMN